MDLLRYVRFFIVLGLFFSRFVLAQEEEKEPEYGWQNEIVGTLNFTQASFDNWAQGGESAVAWQVSLNTESVLEQERYTWTTNSRFTFGLAKVGDTEARKSADEIKLESVYTRKVSPLLNPFIAFTAVTQFVSGFEFDGDRKTKVSQCMDPGYFTQSVGFGYTHSKVFKTRLGATVKETITNDFPVPYADDPDTPEIEKVKIEPGISSVTNFKTKFQENILFSSKLDIFSDLEAFDRIDILWENNLTFKISKLFNVNFNVDLLYDKDVSDTRQLKQVLAIGITYSFVE